MRRSRCQVVTGAQGETQGLQGTVSSFVFEDGRRLLKSLREMKVLWTGLSPVLSARFNIKSILTFAHVENTFSEMRTGDRRNLRLTTGSVDHQRTLEKAVLYTLFILSYL